MTPEANVQTPAYLWFDSEFTSLEPDEGRLLQVALVVTDRRLRRLTAPERDVNLCVALTPDAVVSDWVKDHLGRLLEACRSAGAVSVAEADRRLAALVDEAVGPVSQDIKGRPVLAGNTVHMDLALVRRFLPEFSRRIHYRLLDISTLKVLWNDSGRGPVFEKDAPATLVRHLPAGLVLPAASEHDAYYDVHATLAEAHYYLRELIWPPEFPAPTAPVR